MDTASVSQDHPGAEDQAKPQEPIATHPGVGMWPLWFFITPVIYVLSVGPVCKIEQALHLDQTEPGVEHIIKTVYWPLDRGAMRSPPLAHALAWYLFSVWKVEMP